MAEIIKVVRETLPAARFIGQRYLNANRGPEGSFAVRWQEWLQQNRFQELGDLGPLAESEGASFGLMRCLAHAGGDFEYWIGMLFPAGTAVPGGYDSVDLPAGEVGVCFLHGSPDNGELYGPEAYTRCLEKVQETGKSFAAGSWCFERYNCPRFTTPDRDGKVILDYGFYLT